MLNGAKKDNQQTSQKIKELLDKVGQDFDVTYVDDLASQGVPWGDSLLETLCDLVITLEERDVLTKMQTLPLSKEDVVSLRGVLAEQVERLHLLPNNVSERQEGETSLFTNLQNPLTKVEDKRVSQVVASPQSPFVTPDLVIEADNKKTWLSKIGQDLED